MASILRKFKEIGEFLRYGPTRLEQLRARGRSDDDALERIRLAQGDLERALNELTHSVMRKAADVDLQFVRASLAADLQREAGWLRDRLAAVSAALDSVQRGADSRQAGAAIAAPASVAAAEDAFYPALERQFRGTREEIRRRQEPYRDWVAGLPEGPVGDLGCGRGEWLELLREWGRDAVGVDLNPMFADQARALGFDVACGDMLQWLGSRGDGSMAAITSFHVVEHIPFGMLLRVVEEARRVLRPGGRLILETPNPENLSVATHGFWLDPTHLRPLPPALLEFVLAHAGLAVEATLRLSPPEGDGSEIADATLRALMMQGRDYAVVARKPLPAGR